jgi:hypothetical protein
MVRSEQYPKVLNFNQRLSWNKRSSLFAGSISDEEKS